jgi:hypothetical protein
MPEYFEFEVSLQEITPRIWRRFRLRATLTFASLSSAIQESFGWAGGHLWEFRRPGRRGDPIAGVPDEDGEGLDGVPDGARVRMSSYFKGAGKPRRCFYTYDFGDNWDHDVKLVKIVEDADVYERRLLDGARACPPEDCGGYDGYQRMRTAVETGEDPWDDDEELLEWLGDWDPEEFDLEATKRAFDRGPRGAKSRRGWRREPG